VTALLVKLWRLIQGPLQWYLLWLAQAKFMVAVSGVVLNDQGQVLLLRHRFWPEESWGLPGGYIHRAETLEAALAREILEETGYLITPVSLLKINSGYKLRLEVSYLARLNGGSLKLDSREVIEARFFPVDGLPEGVLRAHSELIALACSIASD
jgi:ADP-ribose pyrophosphatase YjhB (NUDIX family)